jgi:mono/diheme cytochrome c family protein
MVRTLTFLFFAAVICCGARAEDGSAEAGLAYAGTVCSECHAIRSDDFLSPNPKAPSFAKIASTPGVTGAALFRDLANVASGHARLHHTRER